MKNRESVMEELLSARQIKSIYDITEKLPFLPCYVGPGRWVKTLKELHAAKNKKE